MHSGIIRMRLALVSFNPAINFHIPLGRSNVIAILLIYPKNSSLIAVYIKISQLYNCCALLGAIYISMPKACFRYYLYPYGLDYLEVAGENDGKGNDKSSDVDEEDVGDMQQGVLPTTIPLNMAADANAAYIKASPADERWSAD